MDIVGIYKITSPSGKMYIGQSINIKKRWNIYIKYPESFKNQIKLYNSIKKYGPKNHKFEIIEECNELQLLERETYWKIFYKVLELPSLCCRIDGKGGRNSNETKQKQSISAKLVGVGKWNKGRIQSSKEKKLRSKIKLGYKPTSTHINNMSKSMLGKNTKPIICINTGIEYKSIREASKLLNINERSISNNLVGLSKQTKNKITFKYK
jgi:group I intron endonuclease